MGKRGLHSDSLNQIFAKKIIILLISLSSTLPLTQSPYLAGYHRHSRREAGPGSEADRGGHDRQVQVAAASEQELTVDIPLKEREKREKAQGFIILMHTMSCGDTNYTD